MIGLISIDIFSWPAGVARTTTGLPLLTTVIRNVADRKKPIRLLRTDLSRTDILGELRHDVSDPSPALSAGDPFLTFTITDPVLKA
jgi:hypothetical protein